MLEFDREQVILYMKERKFAEALDYINLRIKENPYYEVIMFGALTSIAHLECAGQEKTCILDISDDWQDWFAHFHSIKLLVRRLEIPHLRKSADDLLAYKKQFDVSDTAIRQIIRFSTIRPERTEKMYERLLSKQMK